MLDDPPMIMINDVLNSSKPRAFLSCKMQFIENLIATNDVGALSKLFQEYQENMAYLTSELKQMGETITNMNNMQQYVCDLP